jgi:hypothetical protein
MGEGDGVRCLKNHAVYLLDDIGRVIGWPLPPARGEGYPSHVSAFYTPEDRAVGLPARDLRLASDGGLQLDAWRLRSDGSRFWASVVMTPIQDEVGHALGIVLVLSNQIGAPRTGDAHRGSLPTKFDRRKR